MRTLEEFARDVMNAEKITNQGINLKEVRTFIVGSLMSYGFSDEDVDSLHGLQLTAPDQRINPEGASTGTFFATNGEILIAIEYTEGERFTFVVTSWARRLKDLVKLQLLDSSQFYRDQFGGAVTANPTICLTFTDGLALNFEYRVNPAGDMPAFFAAITAKFNGED